MVAKLMGFAMSEEAGGVRTENALEETAIMYIPQ